MVSRIDPYVPGTGAFSCSGVSVMQVSINRSVAQTWCANASSSCDPLMAAEDTGSG